MNRNIWKAWFCFMAFTMGTSLVAPLLPIYQRHFGFSDGVVTLFFVTYVFFLIPSMLFFGQVSDQVGRKRVLLPAMVLLAIGSLLLALAWHPGGLFLARVLQGLASGAFLGTCTAYIVDLASPPRRAWAAQLASVSIRFGLGLGPGLAGLIAQYSQAPLVRPFQVHLGLMLPGIGALLLAPETINPSGFRWLGLQLGVPASERKAFFAFLVPSALLLTLLDGTALAILPLFVFKVHGIENPALIGALGFLVLVAGSVAQLIGWRMPPKQSIVLGVLLSSLAFLFLIGSFSLDLPLLLVVGTIVVGAGNGLTVKGGVTLSGLIVPAEDRGKILSTYYVACYLGMSVPILALGFLSDAIGLYPTFVLLGGIAIAVALMVSLWGARTLGPVTLGIRAPSRSSTLFC